MEKSNETPSSPKDLLNPGGQAAQHPLDLDRRADPLRREIPYGASRRDVSIGDEPHDEPKKIAGPALPLDGTKLMSALSPDLPGDDSVQPTLPQRIMMTRPRRVAVSLGLASLLGAASWYFVTHGGATSTAIAASEPKPTVTEKRITGKTPAEEDTGISADGATGKSADGKANAVPRAKTDKKQGGDAAKENRAVTKTSPAPPTPTADMPRNAKSKIGKSSVPPVSKKTLLSLGQVEYETMPAQFNRYVRVERGDTFLKLLLRAGVNRKDAHIAVTTMSGIFNPRKIRPGRRIALSFGVLGGDQERFLGMRFDSAYDKTVQVQRQQGGDFVAAEVHKEMTDELIRGDGRIESSLFVAGLRRGVPARAMIRLIHLFSFSVDFQRDIRKGDSFEILYRQHKDDTGKVVRMGDILYASLNVRGKTLKLYFFKTGKGKKAKGEYFDEKGESSRRALMRTPVDGARLSSRFGMRRHPILGYSRMHTGIDFAAPTGTPIYAAGDGTVVKVGWFGGYGRYIRLRHNRDYHTAYAHMVRFRKGMRVGRRVRQGEIIGYVGTTGRSTGPHLHYEVHYRGRPINPLTLKLPANKNLVGKQRKRFLAMRKDIDRRFAALGKNGASDAVLVSTKTKANKGCTPGGLRLDPTDKRPCKAAGAKDDGGSAPIAKDDDKSSTVKKRQEAAKPQD